MRYDINVYWVEDTPTWSIPTRRYVELALKEKNIYVNFVVEKDAEQAKNTLIESLEGFKKYDLFFIDYNISSTELNGSAMIRMLRGNNIDVDVLFYSAYKKQEIDKLVVKNLSAYEGVYLANRNTFKEKALSLIIKNTRRQLSLKSIRGMLMDNTSENDFIIKSYIAEKYEKLTEEQICGINDIIKRYIAGSNYPSPEGIMSFKERINKQGIRSIKDFLGEPSYLVPLELKYIIFSAILNYVDGKQIDVFKYKNEVVDKRNVLAHKKIECCDNLSRIKYCDTLAQYKNRMCDKACDSCTCEHSITFQEWQSIRQSTIDFSNQFDEILKKLNA